MSETDRDMNGGRPEAILLYESEGIAVVGLDTGTLGFLDAKRYEPPTPHVAPPLALFDATGADPLKPVDDEALFKRIRSLEERNPTPQNVRFTDPLYRTHVVVAYYGAPERLWVLRDYTITPRT